MNACEHVESGSCAACYSKLRVELRDAHQRLNETRIKDFPGPLAERINQYVSVLNLEVDERSCAVKAMGWEMDSLRAQAMAAKARQAEAELRATRLSMTSEQAHQIHVMQQHIEVLETKLRSAPNA